MNDVHENFYADKNMFDFSEYWENSKLYNKKNKKVIGNMKDETESVRL